MRIELTQQHINDGLKAVVPSMRGGIGNERWFRQSGEGYRAGIHPCQEVSLGRCFIRRGTGSVEDGQEVDSFSSTTLTPSRRRSSR